MKIESMGFWVGVGITLCGWWFIAQAVECSKVSSGYLTLYGKTYTVTLFDTLEKPEKEK